MKCRTTSMLAAMLGLATLLATGTTADAHRDPRPDQPRIQVALLLDTSNSMDGLIAQAKTRLWRIVNEFATAKQKGRQPLLEVALFEYGNSRLPAKGGYVREVQAFSGDLDTLSERLFALTTQGGDEYCGHVIREALTRLKWSDRKSDLKLIFIAGNEPFTQGDVFYEDACRLAKRSGVVVNTIHCGDHETGITGKWKAGAIVAGGSYMSINHEKSIADVRCPQDEEILRLNKKLNETYVCFGKEGEAGLQRQTEMDWNACEAGNDVIIQRSRSKSTKLYSNGHWDLVDATKNDGVKIEDVPEAELSEDLQKMSVTERKRYVEAQSRKRVEIQERIRELHVQREKHLADTRKAKGESGAADTLDAAMIRILRDQAEAKGFTFSE